MKQSERPLVHRPFSAPLSYDLSPPSLQPLPVFFFLSSRPCDHRTYPGLLFFLSIRCFSAHLVPKSSIPRANSPSHYPQGSRTAPSSRLPLSRPLYFPLCSTLCVRSIFSRLLAQRRHMECHPQCLFQSLFALSHSFPL